MDKFEYDFGFITASLQAIKTKLNEFGESGWDITQLRKADQANSIDNQGNIEYVWEVFMKRKK